MNIPQPLFRFFFFLFFFFVVADEVDGMGSSVSSATSHFEAEGAGSLRFIDSNESDCDVGTRGTGEGGGDVGRGGCGETCGDCGGSTCGCSLGDDGDGSGDVERGE
mmetsp:Transcript_16011/g.23557  ORF Transcript_16011/g.23557 Transcript_16011/m.23557 type:complete len:106 (+) Transcript_16011:368-685(+)